MVDAAGQQPAAVDPAGAVVRVDLCAGGRLARARRLQADQPRLATVIHWAPRIAAILLILFLGLFSLDVFEMEASPLELLGGFLIHNIPSIGLLVLLIMAWKRPAVGFVAFLAAGVLFGLFFVRDVESLPSLLIFVFPILLIAGLFYADWKWLGPHPPGQIDATA